MELSRKSDIRRSARSLHLQMWRAREVLWPGGRALNNLIPVPVDTIIRSILKAELDEPETIPSEHSGALIAGCIDRGKNLISVAHSVNLTYRLFTMAHEVGHWILHPGTQYFRDRLISGGERANAQRPLVEQEADLFAAELTMPWKPLTDMFREAFGSVVAPNLSEDRVAWMSEGRVNPIAFRQDRRVRALTAANANLTLAGRPYPSLARRFGVSAIAMAIHLEDLGLVV